MTTLVVDASTYVGTVALLDDGEIIAAGSAAMRGRDSEALMPEVAETLKASGLTIRDVSRVVCGAGPGSFTSLRIAVSIAKGIAFGTGAPLFAVSSLALLVAGIGRPAPGEYLAVLDALRGEAYVGRYTVSSSGIVTPGAPEHLVRQSDVVPLADSLGAVAVGPGQAIDRAPDARGALALESLIVQGAVDVRSWEPRYGRKAEAQVKWEAAHRQMLPSGELMP